MLRLSNGACFLCPVLELAENQQSITRSPSCSGGTKGKSRAGGQSTKLRKMHVERADSVRIDRERLGCARTAQLIPDSHVCHNGCPCCEILQELVGKMHKFTLPNVG